MTINRYRLAQNLYHTMIRKDLTAAEVARRTGLNRQTIYESIDGRRLGNLETFLLIANAIGADYNTLLEGVVRKGA